jgi:hypothetical protein
VIEIILGPVGIEPTTPRLEICSKQKPKLSKVLNYKKITKASDEVFPLVVTISYRMLPIQNEPKNVPGFD